MGVRDNGGALVGKGAARGGVSVRSVGWVLAVLGAVATVAALAVISGDATVQMTAVLACGFGLASLVRSVGWVLAVLGAVATVITVMVSNDATVRMTVRMTYGLGLSILAVTEVIKSTWVAGERSRR